MGGSAAGRLDDVRGDVGDLLRRQAVGERRHRALTLRDARDGQFGGRLRLVEVRADVAARPGRGEDVALFAFAGRAFYDGLGPADREIMCKTLGGASPWNRALPAEFQK